MIVKQEQDEIEGYLKDASNLPGGHAERVYLPESEEQVIAALGECRSNGVKVTVAGAGTGLAGGRVPFGGAVIGTARLNRVAAIDADRLRAIVQPGVILGGFQAEVERLGLFYPPDPTERSCFIGGTIATNSSGARTFKYGPTRSFIEGLRIVLADGDLLHLRRGEVFANGYHLVLATASGRTIELELPRYVMPATKHAAGYYIHPGMDAIDLFIGSEGTLGIVTEAELRLIPFHERIFSGVVFFPDEGVMLDFVDEARARSRQTRSSGANGDDIEARALEYIDAAALDLIRSRVPNIPGGAEGGAIWFEQETTEETEEGLLGAWYDLILRHRGLAEDSWFAIGAEDQRKMRAFRHAVPEAVYEHITEHGQTKLGTDMAVPDEHFRELLAFYRSQFTANGLATVVYGHIGNCHLHANIFADGSEQFARARKVYESLVDRALELGGTISAEHGIGKLKKAYLEKLYGSEGVESMRRLKHGLDRRGLIGSGTMFD